MIALPLSSVIGAPISTALLGLDCGGSPAGNGCSCSRRSRRSCSGFVVLRCCRTGRADATWLTDEEKGLAGSASSRREGDAHGAHAQPEAGVAMPRVWRYGLVYFCMLVGLYGFGFWLPQIIASLGTLTNFQVGAGDDDSLRAALHRAGAVGAAFRCDRRACLARRVPPRCWRARAGREWLVTDPMLAFAALCLAAVGIYSGLPSFWALASRGLQGAAAAGAIALINSIGNIGGFLGPTLIGMAKQRTGSFAISLLCRSPRASRSDRRSSYGSAHANSARLGWSARCRHEQACRLVGLAILFSAAALVQAQDERAAPASRWRASRWQASSSTAPCPSGRASSRLRVGPVLSNLRRSAASSVMRRRRRNRTSASRYGCLRQNWSGRYVQVGNGGLAGIIFHRCSGQMVERGHATGVDRQRSHREPVDGRWAIGQPEKVRDFAERAVHLLSDIGRQITAQYYETAAKHSYFFGCSEGGREALIEAQRFPQDFDGIVAGAPAHNWTELLNGFVVSGQALHKDPASFIPPAKLPIIQQAALAACDASDGVKDGLGFRAGELQVRSTSARVQERRRRVAVPDGCRR